MSPDLEVGEIVIGAPAKHTAHECEHGETVPHLVDAGRSLCVPGIRETLVRLANE